MIPGITSRVRNIAQKAGIHLPMSQVMRSVVEIKATILKPASKTLVARTLSHSQVTTEKHYRALETSKWAEGYEVVGKLVGVDIPAVEPVSGKRSRKSFNEEQVKLIQVEFAEEIRLKKPPLKFIWVEFAEERKLKKPPLKLIWVEFAEEIRLKKPPLKLIRVEFAEE